MKSLVVYSSQTGKPEPPVWLADAPDAIGHPNKADIEALNHMIAELFRS